ncbi:MAG: hypothetical protein IPN17_37890 [Deltaproteobacteria bacterium]|nr:hypothetical protein [Deltaproteobacteria bacterium]
MTRALAHRGPDGEGFHVDGPLGLGHRRLAIVDLSPAGAQPMPLDGGAFVIAYNGELYNHQRFRKELEARGERFRGHSDTETLLRWVARAAPTCSPTPRASSPSPSTTASSAGSPSPATPWA